MHFLYLKKLLPAMVLCAVLSMPTWADVWNLSNDWSDTDNPNGPWSYYALDKLGSSVSRGGENWGVDVQPPRMWGPEDGHWIGWSKASEKESAIGLALEPGDIYGHVGPLGICWESPIAGQIEVSGAVWQIRDFGAVSPGQGWRLYLNDEEGAPVAVGSLWGPTRDNPDTFYSLLDVQKGDILKFWTDESYSGGYIALDLTIRTADGPVVVPVPGAALLGLLGLGYSGMKLRRKCA